MRFLTAIALSFISTNASAALDRAAIKAESIQSIAIGGGRPDEICVIPLHFADGKYSEKDLAMEKKLCSLDKNSTAAVCPKLTSTNPGLHFFEVPEGQTAAQIVASKCEDAKLLAKYKSSISCSYTPSIVGYYHLSRILGDAGDVPASVLRTFDLPDHVRIGRIAVSQAPDNQLIDQTWKGLLSHLEQGARSSKRDLLLTSDFQQSYGALSRNPRGEEKYTEFYNGGADQPARASNFKNSNPVVKLISKRQAVDTFIPREFNAANLQKLIQMQDATEFIILDTLMNQQDRFGNIHAEEKYFWLDNGKLKNKDKLKPEEVTQLGAVKAKEMILKDNDCGGSHRPNIVKDSGLTAMINHIDPGLYFRVLKLNRAIGDAAVKEFFMQGLQFTERDFTTFSKNLRDLAQQMQSNCREGKLFLDLDLKDYFSPNRRPVPACDI